MKWTCLLCLIVPLISSCGPADDAGQEHHPSESEESSATFGGTAPQSPGVPGGAGSGGTPSTENPVIPTPSTPGGESPGSESGEEPWGGTEPGSDPPDAGGTVGIDDPIDDDCGYGTIYGLICSKNDQAFVNDALVWLDAVDCDGVPLHLETVSDQDGYYTLENVPSGLQTIHIAKDDWSKDHPVQVASGQLSDVTGVAHKECFQVVQCDQAHLSMSVESSFVTGLADIVIFIDTSGSMKAEAEWVQQNVNSFAQYIGNQQIDYRVVLVGKGYDLCVPPPLGGPNCTDGPNFRHVKEKVGSNNGLEKLIDTYPWYQDFLRSGASTNFIAVTDDNSDESSNWFTNQVFAQTNPGFSNPFVFHSIVAFGDIPFVGCLGGAFGGTVYLELTEQTGGAKFKVCETDWTSIFGQMAETVVNSVTSVCAYEVPDPAKVAAGDIVELIYHAPNGNAVLIPQVADGSACGSGFYFDNPENPEVLLLCPSSCDMLDYGTLDLYVACE